MQRLFQFSLELAVYLEAAEPHPLHKLLRGLERLAFYSSR